MSLDSHGNTPLHMALAHPTVSLRAIQIMIQANPDALSMKTISGDTPLHLACRLQSQDILQEITMASCAGLETALANCHNGDLSPILWSNMAGQTPFSILMDEYQSKCRNGGGCCVRMGFRGESLAALVKILYYGPAANSPNKSLLAAALAIHRKGARVDPAFIRSILRSKSFWDEASVVDDQGNTPLHIEASIPIEKMLILDAPVHKKRKYCCQGACHRRMGVLRLVLEMNPEATKARNAQGMFPLQLVIHSGRPWSTTLATMIRHHPAALHWVSGLQAVMSPRVLERIASQCGRNCVYTFIRARPEMLLQQDG